MFYERILCVFILNAMWGDSKYKKCTCNHMQIDPVSILIIKTRVGLVVMFCT